MLEGAYPGQVSAIYTSIQSWHEDLIVWCWDVWWIGNETVSWNVMHTLEEAAVVNLQHSTKDVNFVADALYVEPELDTAADSKQPM